jgi:hypothetical protein
VSACKGCGVELPPNKAPGQARKWCSGRCRKQTLYAGACVDCGAPTNGYDGPGKASERCVPCRKRFDHENRQWTPETIVAAIQRWADEHGGVPPTASDWNNTLSRQLGRGPHGDDYPSASVVQHEFGTWSAAIKAAGFDAFTPGRYGREGEDPAIIAETVALYRQGLSAQRVGELLDVTGTTVLYRLRKAGEPRRRRNSIRAAA